LKLLPVFLSAQQFFTFLMFFFWLLVFSRWLSAPLCFSCITAVFARTFFVGLLFGPSNGYFGDIFSPLRVLRLDFFLVFIPALYAVRALSFH